MKFIEWFVGKAKSFLFIRRSIADMEWIDLDVQDRKSKEIYEQLFKVKVKSKDYINKQKNLALLTIPSSYGDYTRGKSKQALRTNINKS